MGLIASRRAPGPFCRSAEHLALATGQCRLWKEVRRVATKKTAGAKKAPAKKAAKKGAKKK